MASTLDKNEELSIEQHLSDGSPDELEWQRPDNRFLPIRAADLESVLIADAEGLGFDEAVLRDKLLEIRARIDAETLELRQQIETEYLPFDPDRDTRPLEDLNEVRNDANYELLYARLTYLLDKANFEQLTDIQIEQAIRKAKSRRINVRVQSDKVDHLEIWIRGQGSLTKRKLTWRHPIAGVEVESAIFKRMAVVARLKDDPHVIVKLFKDIPEADVEALLPHAQATMTWLDQIKLLGSGAGALGTTLFKLFSIAISFVTLGKLLWILLIGLITLSARTVSGYQNVRKTRSGQRVQHLYFQNLSNNLSAIQLVLSMVKQEELKEAFIGFVFAHKLTLDCERMLDQQANQERQPAAGQDCTFDQQYLCDAIELYLSQKLDAEIDFDIDDAVETLVRLGFVENENDLRIKSF